MTKESTRRIIEARAEALARYELVMMELGR